MANPESDSDGDSLTLEELIREQKGARIADRRNTHGQAVSYAALSDAGSEISLFVGSGPERNATFGQQNTFKEPARATLAPSDVGSWASIFTAHGPNSNIAVEHQNYQQPVPANAAPFNVAFTTNIFKPSGPRHTDHPPLQSTYGEFAQARGLASSIFSTSLFKSSNSRLKDTTGHQISDTPFSTSIFASSNPRQNDQIGSQGGPPSHLIQAATPIPADLFASSPLRIRQQPVNMQNPSSLSIHLVEEEDVEIPDSPPQLCQPAGEMQVLSTPSKLATRKKDLATASEKVREEHDLNKSPQAQVKQDSGSPSKRRTKATVKSPASKKNPSQKAKAKIPQENPDVVRQRLAAQRIIELEMKAREGNSDESLFGEEVIEDEEVKKQILAEERAAVSKEREARMLELLRKEEEENLAKMEKQRRIAEEAEAKRLERAAEEAAKKLKRDEERKNHQAAEALDLEEKRRLSAERLQRIREEAIRAAEERNRKRQEGVEVAAEELERLKAKHEETRLWAASLTASKTSAAPMDVQETSSLPKASPGSMGVVKDLSFVESAVKERKTPKANRAGENRPESLNSAKATSGLNESMRESNIPSKISSILTEIGVDPEPVSQVPATTSQPIQRPKPAAKKRRAPVETESVAEITLAMLTTPKKTMTGQKPASKNTVERHPQDESEAITLAKKAITDMVNKGNASPPIFTISEVPTPSKQYVNRGTTLSRGTTPEAILPSGNMTSTNIQATFKTRTFVVIIHDGPIGTTTSPSISPLPCPSQGSLPANVESRKMPRPRTEAQKAKRREQKAEKAQAKKKQEELRDEASDKDKGEELDELELEMMLQLELEERQEISEKTKTSEELTPQDATPTHPTFSVEEQARRKQQEEDIRMNLLFIGRDPDAKRASSVESEEDPEPVPRLEIQEPSDVQDQEMQMSQGSSGSDVMDEIEDDVEAEEEHEHPAKKRKLDIHHEESDMMFSVQEITKRDGEEVVQSSLGQYANIKDAIFAFRKQKARYKKRKTIISFTESTTNDLHWCTIFYEPNGAHQQTIWVEPILPKDTNPNPPKFEVSRHKIFKHANGKTREDGIIDNATKQGTFTSREMANKFAHDSLCAYIKPPVPNMNHVTAWKGFCGQITACLETLKEEDVFDVEIENGDGVSWLDVDRVSWVVDVE